MTTPAIADKLRNELRKSIKTEPQAVYLLTETRKLIERDHLRDSVIWTLISLQVGAALKA